MIRILVAAFACLALTACDLTNPTVPPLLRDRFRPSAQQPGVVIVDPDATSSRRTAPILVGVFEERGSSNTLQLKARNGRTRTWITGDNVALYETDGLIIGTSGLVFDLYTAQAPTPPQWRAARLPARGDRVHRRIAGDGQIVIESYSCDFIPKGTVPFDTPQGRIQSREVTESCGDGEISFDNTYLLDGSGRVVATRQWLGPGIGFVTVQFLES